jgi:hypothetical protein
MLGLGLATLISDLNTRSNFQDIYTKLRHIKGLFLTGMVIPMYVSCQISAQMT